MANSVAIERLEKTSRISTLLMALGAIVVLGALWLSYEQLRTLQTEAEAKRKEISGLREALTASRDAIVAFHQRDYSAALGLYDQSLRADPNNAYLLNLKAYTLFKLKRFQDAIDVQNEGIRVDVDYAWGYFDLARFQCASGEFIGARKSVELALQKGPSLRGTMESDGEFKRLCSPILK